MNTKFTFKRYELKYLVTLEQKSKLLELLKNYMTPDDFGQSSILNLYYDTPDFLLIRRSIEKPVYKEKLRVRSYGQATEDKEVFLELKKKYKSVVYKRRIALAEKQATDYFNDNCLLTKTQILKEIDYFKSHYVNIAPRVLIVYDREAFLGKDDGDFRVTFDENILWRDDDLSLCKEKYGNKILPQAMALMEIKVAGGIPLWLTHYLTENKIYKISFSKYGNAYKQILLARKDENYVA